MLKPPIAPMLAQPTASIPEGDYFYEPKWDGFRALIFVDKQIYIGSRGSKELTRYFPEICDQVRQQLPQGSVLDGELVVPHVGSDGHGSLDFSALQQRIHPAESRIQKLAIETPASFVAFDLLQVNNQSLINEAFSVRREALVSLMERTRPPLYITSATREREVAQEWFTLFEGAGLDGVVAKAADLRYESDKRSMLKIKHFRSADCVVAGYRKHKNDQSAVGALLLGLYDDQGRLHFVGSTSSFTMVVRREIAEILQPLVEVDEHPWLNAPEGVRVPGAQSRWSGGKDLSFVPLRPQVVCEVRYDQLEGDRFRHTTTFLRWRPDRDQRSCTYSQLELPEAYDLGSVMR